MSEFLRDDQPDDCIAVLTAHYPVHADQLLGGQRAFALGQQLLLCLTEG